MRLYNKRLVLLFIALPLIIVALSFLVHTISKPFPKDLPPLMIGQSRLVENAIAIAAGHEIIAMDPQNAANVSGMYTFSEGDIRSVKWSPDRKKLAFLRVYGYSEENQKILAELGIITSEDKTPVIIYTAEVHEPGTVQKDYAFEWIDASHLLYKQESKLNKFSLENNSTTLFLESNISHFQVVNNNLYGESGENYVTDGAKKWRIFVDKISLTDPSKSERIIESSKMLLNEFLIAPNEQYAIYVADVYSHVVFHYLDNDRLKEVIDLETSAVRPVVSPNAQYVALTAKRGKPFSSEYDDHLVILNAKGEIVKEITKNKLHAILGNSEVNQQLNILDNAFSFSPDSNKIVFAVYLDKPYLFMADVKGDSIRDITPDLKNDDVFNNSLMLVAW